MKKQRRSWLLIFVGSALFFFVMNRIFFFSPTTVEKISSIFVYPFLNAQKYITDSSHVRLANRKTADQLRKELHQVMLERDELYAKNVELQTTLAYAEHIKEIVEFKECYNQDQVIATIFLRHIGNDGHYIVVDAGENKGIRVDMPVVYKNNLLGRVIEVWPWYSKVLLTTDASCQVAAECVNTKVRGIHQGTNDIRQTSLAHVSHLLQPKKEDLLISSGEGLIFPRGFALGTIEQCEVEGLTYNITVRPPIVIQCIDCCSILRSKA